VRFLGDAAVVFEASNWQTHILPPAAAVVADIIVELRQIGPVSSASVAKAIREQLECDPEGPEFGELLHRLVDIGMLDA
jgi:PqqD family protein of HPr-rel-A system